MAFGSLIIAGSKKFIVCLYGTYMVHKAARVKLWPREFFYIDRLQRLVVLHGAVKKTRKTPAEDLALARANKGRHERNIG